MAYDQNNIFAKIIQGEIPCDKVYEDDFSLAFRDISPKAKIHVLVIPKGMYTGFEDFTENASDKEKVGFSRAISKVIKQLNLSEKGCRLISNLGNDGGQEVPHYHVHILGGETLGALIGK